MCFIRREGGAGGEELGCVRESPAGPRGRALWNILHEICPRLMLITWGKAEGSKKGRREQCLWFLLSLGARKISTMMTDANRRADLVTKTTYFLQLLAQRYHSNY